MTERKFLGVIEVDSGTIVIGDPAYLLRVCILLDPIEIGEDEGE